MIRNMCQFEKRRRNEDQIGQMGPGRRKGKPYRGCGIGNTRTVRPLTSAACPVIFVRLTVQSNSETVSPGFLLARKCH